MNFVIEPLLPNSKPMGITINPDIPVSVLEKHIEKVDLVLLMSVFAGYGGQKFIEESYERLQKVREMVNRINPDCIVEIDGGVNKDNARQLFECGADVLVAGSSVFGKPDPKKAIEELLFA